MRKRILLLVALLLMVCMVTGCFSEKPASVPTITPEADVLAENSTTPSPVVTATSTPATPEPKATPTVVNLLETMGQGDKTELNKFLSNFCEAFYGLNHYAEAEERIHFAFTHSRLNRKSSTVKYENDEMGISAEEVDTILNRFFGNSIPHETPAESQYFVYKNGYFMMPAADGETNAYFSIATDMREHADGNYMVKFSTFYDNENAFDTLQSWYSLTYDEVMSNSQYIHEYDGEAILKAKNGTYEVVSYKVYEN